MRSAPMAPVCARRAPAVRIEAALTYLRRHWLAGPVAVGLCPWRAVPATAEYQPKMVRKYQNTIQNPYTNMPRPPQTRAAHRTPDSSCCPNGPPACLCTHVANLSWLHRQESKTPIAGRELPGLGVRTLEPLRCGHRWTSAIIPPWSRDALRRFHNLGKQQARTERSFSASSLLGTRGAGAIPLPFPQLDYEHTPRFSAEG
jgi:hypothetical protein